MKLDILAIAAHPDDVEISCAGTLIKHIAKGYKAGIVDLTKGELGTRGSAKERMKETEASTQSLGIQARENLGFADGFFENNKEHQLELVKLIRKYQPSIVLAPAKFDRHPDHGRGAQLSSDACFIAGLAKVETKLGGKLQQAHRPKAVYHYIQALHMEPDFVVDITEYLEQKLNAIRAFKSQFYNPDSHEPETFISTPQFLEFVTARAMHFGVPSSIKYGEGFVTNRTPVLDDVMVLM